MQKVDNYTSRGHNLRFFGAVIFESVIYQAAKALGLADETGTIYLARSQFEVFVLFFLGQRGL
jgi:hypothetical protein